MQYQVAPEGVAEFLFNLASAEATIRAATESCSRRVVGVMGLDEVLTTARDRIEERIVGRLQPLLDRYGGRVRILTVQLQEVHPPVSVVAAFRQVATARENKATMINRATAYRKETVPKARGLAQYILADAESHGTKKRLEGGRGHGVLPRNDPRVPQCARSRGLCGLHEHD